MSPTSDSLVAAFRQLTDPRHRRGVRHPFAGLLSVVFLGLLSRHPDFASLARWAKRHWPALREAFGLTRPYAPHATTYSRAAAAFSIDEFRGALAGWLARVMADAPTAAAVDGKTSKQAHDADGDPIHVLNVFAHDARVCLADWPIGDGKETEPEVLKAHLDQQGPGASAMPAHARDQRMGMAYCRPPLDHCAFRPRLSASGVFSPTLRSKISP